VLNELARLLRPGAVARLVNRLSDAWRRYTGWTRRWTKDAWGPGVGGVAVDQSLHYAEWLRSSPPPPAWAVHVALTRQTARSARVGLARQITGHRLSPFRPPPSLCRRLCRISPEAAEDLLFLDPDPDDTTAHVRMLLVETGRSMVRHHRTARREERYVRPFLAVVRHALNREIQIPDSVTQDLAAMVESEARRCRRPDEPLAYRAGSYSTAWALVVLLDLGRAPTRWFPFMLTTLSESLGEADHENCLAVNIQVARLPGLSPELVIQSINRREAKAEWLAAVAETSHLATHPDIRAALLHRTECDLFSLEDRLLVTSTDAEEARILLGRLMGRYPWTRDRLRTALERSTLPPGSLRPDWLATLLSDEDACLRRAATTQVRAMRTPSPSVPLG